MSVHRLIDENREAIFRRLLYMGGVSVFLWAVVYGWLGLWVPTAIEGTFTVQVALMLLLLRYRRIGLRAAVLIQIVVTSGVIVSITLTMGGVVTSGGFLIWAWLLPMAGMILLERRWFYGLSAFFSVFIALVAILDPWIEGVAPLPPAMQGPFLALNAFGSAAVVLGSFELLFSRVQDEQRRVRLSEETWRLTIQNTPASFALKDVRGVYSLVNRQFEELFGLEEGEAIGRTDAELFPPELARLLHELDRAASSRGEALSSEDVLDVGGQRRDLLSTRFFVRVPGGWPGRGQGNGEGGPKEQEETRLCWVAMDVTLRKRLQETVGNTQRLQSLGTLAGGIAHDFNNILMAMSGNLALAAEVLPAWDVAVHHRLGDAQRAVERARALTEQLLTFSRGGAPVRASTSIVATIRDSAAFVLSGTNARLVLEVPDDLPSVQADVGQISQVIQNLTLNAAQAMPDGGTVTVRACALPGSPDLDLDAARRYVRVDVIDHGEGIPDAVRHRIFDPYYTTRASGKGLGLSICYSIVRSHEGRIHLHSRVGEGTTFSVFLPAEEPGPAETATAAAPRPGRTPALRVLIMDDEPDIRDVLARMLAMLGHDVVATAEGGEAIRVAARAREEGNPFRLAILDLTIRGGMGGVECARRLREDDAALQLLASSGFTNDPVLAEPARYGFHGILRKPYGVQRLLEVLDVVATR